MVIFPRVFNLSFGLGRFNMFVVVNSRSAFTMVSWYTVYFIYNWFVLVYCQCYLHHYHHHHYHHRREESANTCISRTIQSRQHQHNSIFLFLKMLTTCFKGIFTLRHRNCIKRNLKQTLHSVYIWGFPFSPSNSLKTAFTCFSTNNNKIIAVLSQDHPSCRQSNNSVRNYLFLQ